MSDNETGKLIKLDTIYFICDGRNIEFYVMNMGEILLPFIQNSDVIVVNNCNIEKDLNLENGVKLLEELNKKQGRTIVMVIHELNNAARFADHIIGVKKGKIVCEGTPKEVMTNQNLKEIFNIDAEIIEEPKSGKPVCITYDSI